MRFFLNISYRGAAYHGWQIQPHDNSVQQTVEQALATLLRQPTPIVGAGRTDAGVNARMTVAHFDSGTDLCADPQTKHRFLRSLNAICRPDIVVNDIVAVADDAHARFDATQRTYRYFVHTADDPFVSDLSWRTPPGLDFQAMNQAARHILGRQDFTSFSKLHTDVKTNICTVADAGWHPMPDPDGTLPGDSSGPRRWYFEITADRFLRNMVRAVVGTLVTVGRHQATPDDVRRIIDSRNRCAAGTSMPAHPLFLWNVKYPYYNSK